jgi:pimeloyl-ACP methyl ester carboxylesterase
MKRQSPQFFHAYVGISQFVNIADSERILDEEGRTRARAQGNLRTLRTMERIGPPPYKDHRDERIINEVTKKLVSQNVPHAMTPAHFIGLALQSPDYSLGDDIRLLRGIKFSGRALEKEIYRIDLFRAAPELDVPVYFLEGRYDTVLSPTLVERYYKALVAPRGKHLIWFEHSDHWLHLEEREKYRATLRRILSEIQPAQQKSD